MAVELQFLAWSALLTILQLVLAVAGAGQQAGLAALAGNRDPALALTGWAARAQRAHLNMLESLPIFAAAVIVAVAGDRTNAVTAMGASIFFWARLVYVPVYLAGITWVRTLVWGVSLVGLLLVLSQLL